METRVEHAEETVGGKTYPLTVTRQTGPQEVTVGGRPSAATEITVFESPLGTSRCRTLAGPEAPPEVRAANLRQVREAAARAMLDMGIW